jgi:futalosine hydrolase
MSAQRPLVLVPTELERRKLLDLGGFPGAPAPVLSGFGPVAAAARTAQLLAELSPPRVLLVGLAGALRSGPLGRAISFGRVRLDGVGVGTGSSFVPASRIGFAQWDGGTGPIEEALELSSSPEGGPELLTVCAASATAAEAEERRARYPLAAAEDMEAFGVALACRIFGTPLLVVRGLSNQAGERDSSRWLVHEALAAARTEALLWLGGAPR